MHLLLIACCLLLAVWINFQVDGSSGPKWTYFYLPSEYALMNSEFQRVLDNDKYKTKTKCVENPEAERTLEFWYVDCKKDNHVVFVSICNGEPAREYIEVERNNNNELKVLNVADKDTGIAGITGAGYEEDWGNDAWEVPGEVAVKDKLMTKIKDQLKYQKLTYSDDGGIPAPWNDAWTEFNSFSEFCPCPNSLPLPLDNPDILKTKEENGVHYVKMSIACHLNKEDKSKASHTVKIDIALDKDLESLGDDAATLVAIGTTLPTIKDNEIPKCESEAETDCPPCDGIATGPTCKYVKADTEDNGSMKIGPGFTLLLASLLCILASRIQ